MLLDLAWSPLQTLLSERYTCAGLANRFLRSVGESCRELHFRGPSDPREQVAQGHRMA